jgi:hypothetical protein
MNGIIDVINTGIRVTNTGLRATGGTEIALIKKLAVGGQRPEGSFIAGENGPELVTPTKVYTKSQTASMGAIGGNSMSYSIGQLVLQVEGIKLNTENEISDFLDANLQIFKRKLS